MAPIAIASMMEHIGDISAISATVGENYVEDPGLHRTLIGDGLATSLSALVGGPANTTYGENTGVLELSRVHDPKVIRLAAIYAVVLSFIPKFAGIISTLPAAIVGGVSFIHQIKKLNYCGYHFSMRTWFLFRTYLPDCRNKHHFNRSCHCCYYGRFVKCHFTRTRRR